MQGRINHLVLATFHGTPCINFIDERTYVAHSCTVHKNHNCEKAVAGANVTKHAQFAKEMRPLINNGGRALTKIFAQVNTEQRHKDMIRWPNTGSPRDQHKNSAAKSRHALVIALPFGNTKCGKCPRKHYLDFS